MSQLNQNSSTKQEPSLDLEQDESLHSKFSSTICEEKSKLENSNEKTLKSKKSKIKFLNLRKMINAEAEEKSNSYQKPSNITRKNLIKSSNSLESTSSKSSILKSSFTTSSLTSLITSIKTSISTPTFNSAENHSFNMVTTSSSNLLPFSNLNDKKLNMQSTNETKKRKNKNKKKIDSLSACFFKARSTSISGLEAKGKEKKMEEYVKNLADDEATFEENGNKLSVPNVRLLKQTQSLDHGLIPKASVNSMQHDCTSKPIENSQVRLESLLIETVENSEREEQTARTESTERALRTLAAETVENSSEMRERKGEEDELGSKRSTVLNTRNSIDTIELIEENETKRTLESNEKVKKEVRNKNEIKDRLQQSKSNSNLSMTVNTGKTIAAAAAIESNVLNELNNSNITNAEYLKEPSNNNLTTSGTKEEKNINKSANSDLACLNSVKERRINEDKLNSHFNSYLTSSGSNGENLKTKNSSNNSNNSNDSNNSRILSKKRINKSKSINNLRDNLVNDGSTNQSSTSLAVDDEVKNSKKQNSALRSKSFNHLTNDINKKLNKTDNLNQQPVAELNQLQEQQQQQQPLKISNRLNQKGGALCKLKKFAKGFNTSSSSASTAVSSAFKNRIRESLCAQSKNCIEQLLLHEQCKTDSNKCISPSGIENEIKMKKMRFRRSDYSKKEYNLTKSMKSVDYKDLTLKQILAFRKFRSKTKITNQEKTSELLNKNTNQLTSQTQQSQKTIGSQKSKFFSLNKMVLPGLQNSPVCTESPQTDKCFDIYNKKDHHSLFTSKLLKNDESFNCENIQSNKQVIPTKPSIDHQLVHQCKINNNKKCDSDLKSKPNKWIQLSGHDQSFFNSDKPGVILKRNEQNESIAYKKINEMNDKIIEFMPKFYSVIDSEDGNQFIELQDLLTQFDNPCIMDLKMGSRTFLESDVSNRRARPDLYEKLIKIDVNAATDDEHKLKAITKLRYMTFRENLSSSATLGFRIDGFRCKCNGMIKDFKYLRQEDDVKKVLKAALPLNRELKLQLLNRLESLKSKFKESEFFKSHEIVGSSLLIVYDDYKINVWLIDLAKCVELPSGVKIDHKRAWNLGNHEDGYLTGLKNLISIIKDIL